MSQQRLAGFDIAKISSSTIQDFILAHENDDENKILLKYRDIDGVPTAAIVSQITGRRKAKDKLPLWYQTPKIVYPASLNLEQSSSEATALFKASVVKSECTGFDRATDLTGGFGIDSFFLSNLFGEFQYFDVNLRLLEIVEHNHHQLKHPNNITYRSRAAKTFAESDLTKQDLIFLDPSRRNDDKKVFKLSECSPDIGEIQSKLFGHTELILLKASPLLDIQQGIREIGAVKKVFIVSVRNECKELLFLSQKGFSGDPLIEAVNIDGRGEVYERFGFHLAEEAAANATFSEPKVYLYEPNASVMKSGAFKLVSERFGILKLHSNTHLYTSDQLVNDFPGRVFKVEEANAEPRKATTYFPEGKANVMVRNYPLSANELKSKWKLGDGGDLYLIGFSGQHQKYVVAATRVK